VGFPHVRVGHCQVPLRRTRLTAGFLRLEEAKKLGSEYINPQFPLQNIEVGSEYINTSNSPQNNNSP